jgi:hypothetical protein
MRNNRQMASAFVLAAILSSAMPLSADTGAISTGISRCAVVLGLGEMGLPNFVITLLWGLFGCN